MQSDPYEQERCPALLALLLTAIVLGGSLAVCFWPSQDPHEGPFSVTGTVTGLSSYNQPKLDIRAETLTEQNLPLAPTARDIWGSAMPR
jgi:hypothetical protein